MIPHKGHIDGRQLFIQAPANDSLRVADNTLGTMGRQISAYPVIGPSAGRGIALGD